MNINLAVKNRENLYSQFGMSLIELLVAMAISSILAIAIIELFNSSKDSYYVQEDSSKLQESGRYAFDMLMQDLRRAGYYGYSGDLNAEKNGGSVAIIRNTNSCENNSQWALMLDQKIIGTNSQNDTNSPYKCLARDYITGDVIAIRYVSGENETVFDQNRFYIRSSFYNLKIFRGVDANIEQNLIDTIKDKTPINTGILRAYAYYIGNSGRSCKFTDKNGKAIIIPALFRKSLNNMGLPVREEVASGIENIQFRYGIDSNGNHSVNAYYDAQDISLDKSRTPNWSQVLLVKFWILARADCPATQYVNNTEYNFADILAYKPNDKFKRKLFTSTVALRN